MVCVATFWRRELRDGKGRLGGEVGSVLAETSMRLNEEEKLRLEAWFIGALMMIAFVSLVSSAFG